MISCSNPAQYCTVRVLLSCFRIFIRLTLQGSVVKPMMFHKMMMHVCQCVIELSMSMPVVTLSGKYSVEIVPIALYDDSVDTDWDCFRDRY